MFALYPFKSGIEMKKKDITTHVSEQQFLALLRAGLWGQSVEMTYFPENGTPEWKGILYLGKTQAVLPLIYDGMLGLPAGMQLKGPALMKLIAYVDKIEKLNMELNDAVSEISSRLSAAGIRSVLLKGQGLAALYPNPLRRQCGDIDLYVGEENYRKAAEIIRGWSEVHDEMPETSKHIGFGYKNLEIELHMGAFEIHDTRNAKEYRSYEKSELGKDDDRISFPEAGGQNAGVTVPPVGFNIFYVFYHGFNHFMESGLGLRQLCDLAILLHHYNGRFDPAELEARLKSFKLNREWQLFAGILVNFIGLPEQEAPLFDSSFTPLSRKLLETIFKDGNFGQHKDLPDFSRMPKLLRKAGNLGIHHVILARRAKFSGRQTFIYYASMWRNGMKNIVR